MTTNYSNARAGQAAMNVARKSSQQAADTTMSEAHQVFARGAIVVDFNRLGLMRAATPPDTLLPHPTDNAANDATMQRLLTADRATYAQWFDNGRKPADRELYDASAAVSGTFRRAYSKMLGVCNHCWGSRPDDHGLCVECRSH